ncbi:gamma-glutamylcyclotransferase [Methylibium sp.]|uniref:gamma-glutamylcyclotransferase n=1 Tax=Methylibium sp. TaxID=2067992 RepID=UPI003D13D247
MDYDPEPAPCAEENGAVSVAPLRDPQVLFERTLGARNPKHDVWVFGYASLIWRPEFEAAEQRLARVHGQHRAFRMRSRINRGTPDRPGLVCALVPGGSCSGMVYRLEPSRADTELLRLWEREMFTGVYDPKWLQCHTAQGQVTALAFTLSKQSPNYTGELDDDTLIGILRHARGRFGSTLDYLIETATCLRRCGIRDQAIERQVALAQRAGLTA